MTVSDFVTYLPTDYCLYYCYGIVLFYYVIRNKIGIQQKVRTGKNKTG